MTKKNNIRSIRFSDEMIEMIESQAGETFTAKFEALVTRCMWELPHKQKQLKVIQEQIEQEKKKLDRIWKQTNELENAMWQMNNAMKVCKSSVERATINLDKLIKGTQHKEHAAAARIRTSCS